MMTPQVRPLTGITVVAVEQAVAAPFATRQLADLGARIIKIERPGSGDFARHYDSVVHGTSAHFLWLNRGKQSCALDFRSSRGHAALQRLIRRADVFIQNLSPGAAVRAGLDIASLATEHPNLIACSVSGYRPGTPAHEAKAYDMLIQGETGVFSVTGDGDQMVKVGISVADISAGMYAYSGILAAILHRQRTGVALPVEVSLFDAMTEWMAHPLYYTRFGGRPPARSGLSHPTIAPYGAFALQDGQQVLIAVQNDREWKRMCEVVLERPDLTYDPNFRDNASRVSNRGQVDAMIRDRLSAVSPKIARALLDAAGIPCGSIRRMEDLANDAELVRRYRWVETPSPGGPAETLYPPAIPGSPDVPFGAVPELGSHTRAVLTDVGYTERELDELVQSGVIQTTTDACLEHEEVK
jgi:formyl-CoA transferase